jgi:peptide deformylase
MSVREIVTVGHPVLRERAREVSWEELRTPELQQLIDDLIETMREANGAGLAANQVGDLHRVAVVEVREGNPRYPYKPPIPLTVMVNPELESAVEETVAINEGCLSVPDLRGDLERHAAVRVRYLDRDGEPRQQVWGGLAAGTFQHEVDHLNGILFLDRVSDPSTFSTWEEFEHGHGEEWAARARDIEERFGGIGAGERS